INFPMVHYDVAVNVIRASHFVSSKECTEKRSGSSVFRDNVRFIKAVLGEVPKTFAWDDCNEIAKKIKEQMERGLSALPLYMIQPMSVTQNQLIAYISAKKWRDLIETGARLRYKSLFYNEKTGIV